ncbi:MAG: hypothetical protein ACOYEH_08375 [Caldicoprobacterales bacterium]
MYQKKYPLSTPKGIENYEKKQQNTEASLALKAKQKALERL